MEGGERLGAALARIETDVVADRIRRPEADHRLRVEPALGHDLRQHLLRILVELTRRLALRLVLEDGRKATLHVPGLEERRPVDIGHEIGRRRRSRNTRVPAKVGFVGR